MPTNAGRPARLAHFLARVLVSLALILTATPAYAAEVHSTSRPIPTSARAGSKHLSAPTPTVSGTPKTGSTLTAKTGTWKPAATLTYQWLRDAKPITSATKPTYTLTPTDVGKKISVRITGSKSGYSTLTKTSPTLIPTKGSLTASTPTVSGTPKTGSTLTAKTGTWKPAATLTYQWLRDAKPITSATKPTYTLTPTDVGKKISVRITGSKSGYSTLTKTSPTLIPTKGSLTASTPTVSGTPKTGSTLTAKTGTWKPAATLTYQWLRDAKPITSATKPTYTLTPTDAGTGISVRITATAPGYLSAASTSSRITVASD